MNEEQQRIWDYLNANAIGITNKKSSTDIRNNCNLITGDATNVYVRNLITNMILNHNCCIGTKMWVSGYWILQTRQEILDVLSSLEYRANSIYDRANALKTTWNTNNPANLI